VNNKRFRALALALFTAVSTVVPVRHVYAQALPLPTIQQAVVYAFPSGAAITAGGAVGSGALVTAGVVGLGVLVVGAGLAYAYLKLTDADGNSVRVPLTTDPNKAPQPPVAAPSVSYANSGGTQTRYFTNSGGSAVNFATPQEACVSWRPDAVVKNSYLCAIASDANYTYGYSSFQQTVAGSGCPVGYTDGGSGCVLSNPRKVTDDKTCDILYSNGQFATADDLNCPAQVSADKLSPMIRDGKVVAYGTNSSGQPLVFTVTPGQSVTTLSVQEQVQATNQTQVQTTSATVNPVTGEVLSVQTSVATGQIASPSASSSPTTATADATNSPQVSTNPNSQLAPDIKFPTDYARQGEAQNAANPIKQSVDKLGDISNASLNDPVNPDSAEFDNGFFKNTFNGLSAWSVPGHVSECPKPDLSYTVFGHYTHIILDAHCTLYESVKPLIALAFNVVWVVVALFIVLGA